MEDFVDAEVVHISLTEDHLSKIAWKTAEGERILVKDMEDKHIRNCALFLMGMGYMKCTAPETVRIAWLRVFRMEWERREMQREYGTKKFRCYPSRRELLHD